VLFFGTFITIIKYMSVYKGMHVNVNFLNQEKGLYVDKRAKTRNMQNL
jgi:hypothetical protein